MTIFSIHAVTSCMTFKLTPVQDLSHGDRDALDVPHCALRSFADPSCETRTVMRLYIESRMSNLDIVTCIDGDELQTRNRLLPHTTRPVLKPSLLSNCITPPNLTARSALNTHITGTHHGNLSSTGRITGGGFRLPVTPSAQWEPALPGRLDRAFNRPGLGQL